MCQRVEHDVVPTGDFSNRFLADLRLIVELGA